MMTYWLHLQGHNNHPTISAIEPCWEHGKMPTKSFGLVDRKKVSKMGIMGRSYSPVVVMPATPPWLLLQLEIDCCSSSSSSNTWV